MEEVVLVDSRDREIGKMEKLEAHRKGHLHRAFSVLLFSSEGKLLIHKRSADKYHCSGLWSNACCSHPFPGEPVHLAAKRRLSEEAGLTIQPEFLYRFIYKAPLDKGLTEHELDHVFWAVTDDEPKIIPSEVEEWKTLTTGALRKDMAAHPERYTPWFHMIIERLDTPFFRQLIF